MTHPHASASPRSTKKNASPAKKTSAKLEKHPKSVIRAHAQVAPRASAKAAARTAAKASPKSKAIKVAEAPPVAPAPPEPHVTHDRKVHLEPDAPKKATAEDFLSHPDPDEKLPGKMAEVTEPASVAEPVSIISVVRPTTERPQLPPPEEMVATNEILPELYNKRGRLVMPPPLKGSHEILVRQNVNADHDGLERIQDDEDLARMRQAKVLVALPVNAGLQIDDRLPMDRRYTRPWAAQFLLDMGRAHYAHFHTALQINSAVRTVKFQVKLIRTNGNAAPADGDTASPHLTGQAIDIAKKGLSLTEVAWMRGYLLPLVQEGKVDVEEEFQQSCFHISVYRRYMPSMAPKRIVVTHRPMTRSLAAAMPQG